MRVNLKDAIFCQGESNEGLEGLAAARLFGLHPTPPFPHQILGNQV
jgi:hypothetical protein